MSDGQAWELVLPPGWVTLPVQDVEAGHAAIRRLLDRAVQGKHRDELAPTRIELDQELRRTLAQAREGGASHLHVLAEPIRGIPVSASLAVAPVSVDDDGDLMAAVTTLLAPAEGVVEHGRRTLGTLRSLRRRRRVQSVIGDLDPEPYWQTCVDYVVTLDPTHMLVLTFTTVTDEVADELVDLFDAMAQTLRRRETPVSA